ncbi:MAG: MFS transporter [Candidatus Nealsonbacteria bacterium]
MKKKVNFKTIFKKINKLLPLNKVIRILIFSDVFLLFGWGLIMPILAIFIGDTIQGGDAKVAGTAVGVYWIVKSIAQIPISHRLDKNDGERDDYYSLIFGTLLASLTPFGFLFATLPWHVYLIQAIHALGMAFAVPSWSAMFTRHIDKKREALSWGVHSSSLGLGAGVAGIIGGAVAKTYGFAPIFIAVAVCGIIASFLFFLISKDIIPKERVFPLPKPF